VNDEKSMMGIKGRSQGAEPRNLTTASLCPWSLLSWDESADAPEVLGFCPPDGMEWAKGRSSPYRALGMDRRTRVNWGDRQSHVLPWLGSVLEKPRL